MLVRRQVTRLTVYSITSVKPTMWGKVEKNADNYGGIIDLTHLTVYCRQSTAILRNKNLTLQPFCHLQKMATQTIVNKIY